MTPSPAWMRDPQGLALLEAAKLHPEDTSYRLVLSDWLEEQGESEAAEALRNSLKHESRWIHLPDSVAERWQRIKLFRDGWPVCQVAVSDFLSWPDSPVPVCPWLTILHLRYDRIPFDSIKKLSNSPHLANLSTLEIWRIDTTHHGDELVRHLSENKQLNKLSHLDLWNNQLSYHAANSLAKSPQMSQLVYLLLCCNSIGDTGVDSLTRSHHLTRLRWLYLGKNNITAQGALALANSPQSASLLSLDLWQNSIGDEGTRALAYSRHLSQLTFLGLDANGITNKGARYLVDSPYLSQLKELSVSANPIDQNIIELLKERYASVRF
jgi:uncharacterized protein (TIGR02996 family)